MGGRDCVEFNCADDFLFAQDTTVTGAIFYGAPATGSIADNQSVLGGSDAFTYDIFADDGSGPGTVLQSGAGTNKVLAASSVPVNFGQAAVLSFDFNTPFQALAGTTYWIGFASGTLPFYIADLDALGMLGRGQQCLASGSCPAGYFETQDLVFQLEGDVGVVPLPAALPLFGMALGGLGMVGRLRRRRRASA